MLLPPARGTLGDCLHEMLRGPVSAEPISWPEPASHDDRALSLWVLHELHYRGFDDVDDRWEWSPATLDLRWRLESELEGRLRRRFERAVPALSDGDLAVAIRAVVDGHEGPSLAAYVRKDASREQVLDLFRQRSIYHLKEADPTSWVVPRLEATPKAALLQLQYDEYGAGSAERLHHELFTRGMTAVGLDATYGAYVDEALSCVLEQNNVMSLFGLHRRLRGAALGHLAAFETTSSIPSSYMVRGLRRLDLAQEMVDYYDEHVEADAVHDQLAIHDICAPLVAAEPELRSSVLFGVWSCLDLEARTAADLLDRWEHAEERSA